LYDVKARSRLSRAALETLAIIAFRQPISKVEISAIRGVNSEGVIKGLLERNLVTITGRDTGAGRSLMFSTTKEFLQYFSLDNIADLPKPKEIEELLAEGEGSRILTELSDESFLEKIGESDQKPPSGTIEGDSDSSLEVADENETQ
jgi:segregation and condensation protein B